VEDWLREILTCPDCRAALRGGGDGLICGGCGRDFRIADGVPSLLPRGLDLDLTPRGGEWSRWRRYMGRFISWRDRRYRSESRTEAALERMGGADERLVELAGLGDEDGLVLDVGCGSGYFRDKLPPAVRYVGLDPLPAARDPRSQRLPPHIPLPRLPVVYVQGVGEALPFADGCMDVVLAMGSLDHSRDPELVLPEAVRVLRRGGKLCLRQGASRRTSRLRKLLRLMLRPGGTESTHPHHFTPEEPLDLVGSHARVVAQEFVGRRGLICALKE